MAKITVPKYRKQKNKNDDRVFVELGGVRKMLGRCPRMRQPAGCRRGRAERVVALAANGAEGPNECGGLRQAFGLLAGFPTNAAAVLDLRGAGRFCTPSKGGFSGWSQTAHEIGLRRHRAGSLDRMDLGIVRLGHWEQSGGTLCHIFQQALGMRLRNACTPRRVGVAYG